MELCNVQDVSMYNYNLYTTVIYSFSNTQLDKCVSIFFFPGYKQSTCLVESSRPCVTFRSARQSGKVFAYYYSGTSLIQTSLNRNLANPNGKVLVNYFIYFFLLRF